MREDFGETSASSVEPLSRAVRNVTRSLGRFGPLEAA
jgi:hypothetical protein